MKKVLIITFILMMIQYISRCQSVAYKPFLGVVVDTSIGKKLLAFG